MGKYPTMLLSDMVRDRKVMTLEEAHWRLSHMSASAIGLEGIGTLERGMPADIVVYDMEKRSEEHTSELPSLMRISYAVFCLKKKQITNVKHYVRICEQEHNIAYR